MNNNQILAVWGSPGSGKTTLSVKIAKELEALKYSVALVLCEDELPMLPILLPNGKQSHPSLGHLLALPRISQAEILKHSVPYGNRGNISLLGYKHEDYETLYPEYSDSMARNFLISLTRLCDKVIIDCSHRLLENVLTAVSLATADAVLRVVNADLKSSTYISSQRQVLTDAKFHYDDQITVLNNVMPTQPDTVYSEIFGGASYILPHIPSIEEQFESGKLAESLFGRDARKYEPVVKAIIREVLVG